MSNKQKNNIIMLCQTCHKTFTHSSEPAHCPRCGSLTHKRIPNSLQKSWALTITAFILFLPANLYPIMTITYLGREQTNTILSGVMVLAKEGMVPIALIVFIASIAVPLLKLFCLMFLIMAAKSPKIYTAKQNIIMYRILKLIGRWSMLDIFVLALLVSLVQLGGMSTISPDPAAFYFALMVIFTLFAANTYDTRLLFDNHSNLQNNRDCS